ncbi:MAG: hypothetical protein AAB460_03220, partial [Patescibacteria group bacterium]
LLARYDKETGALQGVKYERLTALLVKAFQEIVARIDALEAQLASVGGSVSTTFAHFTEIVVDTFTVGSEDAPTGITLFDEVTGEAYCLSVRNGDTITRAGECGTVDDEPPSGGGGGGETPPVDEPPAEEPPVEEPPPDESPAEEPPPADEPPADEPPADEPPADEPLAEEPPTDEPPADAPADGPTL